MGGHGGLNILPQKRWNVYNFDNREKVRKDEEKAAKEEQINRQQTRHRDSAVRIQQLRRDRGLDPLPPPPQPPAESKLVNSNLVTESELVNSLEQSSKQASSSISVSSESKSESESKHINLFEGIKIFDPITVDVKKRNRIEEEENEKRKKMMKKMQMKKEEDRVIEPEDEKYRLGYGIAGKGVKAPWYAVKREVVREEEGEEGGRKVEAKTGKKTVEELREERLKREKAEKGRELALVSRNGGSRGRDFRDKERRQWR